MNSEKALIADKPELLNAMLRDQEGRKGVYLPGSYWKGDCRRIVSAIKKYGISEFRSNHEISKGYADSAALDPADLWGAGSWKMKALKRLTGLPPLKRFLANTYLRTIGFHYGRMKHFRQYCYRKELEGWLGALFGQGEMPETTAGGCREYVEIDGRPVAVNYITHALRIFNFSRRIDFGKMESVFEIGGGYGANAHLLLHLYPNIKKYLYLDIPPVIYVGTQYLRRFYPFEVRDYLETRHLKRIAFRQDGKREIISICPWQIEDIDAECDIFWNSASLQEMEADAVRNYADFAARLTRPGRSYACLVNYAGSGAGLTRPAAMIADIFGRFFKLENIVPEKELVHRQDYLIGIRK